MKEVYISNVKPFVFDNEQVISHQNSSTNEPMHSL